MYRQVNKFQTIFRSMRSVFVLSNLAENSKSKRRGVTLEDKIYEWLYVLDAYSLVLYGHSHHSIMCRLLSDLCVYPLYDGRFGNIPRKCPRRYGYFLMRMWSLLGEFDFSWLHTTSVVLKVFFYYTPFLHHVHSTRLCYDVLNTRSVKLKSKYRDIHIVKVYVQSNLNKFNFIGAIVSYFCILLFSYSYYF